MINPAVLSALVAQRAEFSAAMNTRMGAPCALDASQAGILAEARQRGVKGVEPLDASPDSPESEARERGLGPEAGTGQVEGGPSGNVITFNLTGTARVAPLVNDQFWLFSLLADQPINATYALGTVDVVTEDGLWTIALVSLYFGLEPMFLINCNFTGSSSDAAIAGMSVRFRRSDPFGSTSGNMANQSSYQNAKDFRGDRGQFPIAEAIDSWTWLRIVWPMQLAAVTMTGAAFFGPRPDRRGAVPRVAPQIVRSVNG